MAETVENIIKEKSLAEEAWEETEIRYRTLFENNHAVMLLIDPEDGRIVDANPAAAVYYGWSREELRRKMLSEINPLSSLELRSRIEVARRGERSTFPVQHRRADGRIRDVEVFTGPLLVNGRALLFSIVHDVTERQRREAILQARLRLREFAIRHSLEELLRETLDEAERLTGSRIGFFHFLDESQTIVQTQVWSTNTMAGICAVERAANYRGMHYDVAAAGVWVDCIHQRRPVIHNDYRSLPHRRGLPAGHVPVERELVVPVVRDGRIRAVFGVGNKPENYAHEDVRTVTFLADLAWDIAERKRSEEALRELLRRTQLSEERMAIILSSVTDGLVAMDGEECVTLMNPAAERLLGLRAGEGNGRPAQEVIHQAELLVGSRKLLAGEASTASVELSMFDGYRREHRAIQARLAALPEAGGGCGGVIATLFDVTREREIERLKSEFVMTAAHELRTPLTAILGYAELLEEDAENGGFSKVQRREFIREIIAKSEILSRIVDDFLDLGRIEGGRPLALEKSPCRISRVIEGALDHFRRETVRHRFEMSVTPTEVEVMADHGRIAQVLDNLLTNAIKYSPNGGTIRVEADGTGDELRLSVSDQGIGMTAEQAEKIFEKFYRADTSMTAVGGLGLGMCVAKGIVEAHGGRIWVESTPGRGTRVVFTLPAMRQA